MKHCISLIIVLFFISFSLTAQDSNSVPCSQPEINQFDFWVGEWDLSWQGQDGTEGNGKNIIKKILGKCVVEESFKDLSGSGFEGKSVTAFNPFTKKWQQTWVDNSGAYLNFKGGMEGEKMILSRKAKGKEGKEVFQRMVWYNISENSFYWSWESSTDKGKTWQLLWKIHYQRIQG